MKLKEKYQKEITKEMTKKFGYKNPMAVPRLNKIVVNVGYGKEVQGKGSGETKKIIENISKTLELMTGQKPSITRSRKSIAAFKLREGNPVGFKTTLRRNRMYDFLEKITTLVLPRTRDFRGIDLNKVDKYGNLTIGLRDFGAFPEVVIEREKGVFGLELTIVNSAKTREEAIELLRFLGIPFKK